MAQEIVGVEWWAHRRPFQSAGAEGSPKFEHTRYLNHHLHYDTDDVEVEETGEWQHPTISSVLYLTDGSGPTLIINQTKTDPLNPSASSAVITPRKNLFVHFKGDRLHTVLPPEKPPAPERVTIAIAFWGREHVCKERLYLECVDDRVAELPQLSFHWQGEFPLLNDAAIGVASPARVTSTQLRVEGAWG